MHSQLRDGNFRLAHDRALRLHSVGVSHLLARSLGFSHGTTLGQKRGSTYIKYRAGRIFWRLRCPVHRQLAPSSPETRGRAGRTCAAPLSPRLTHRTCCPCDALPKMTGCFGQICSTNQVLRSTRSRVEPQLPRSEGHHELELELKARLPPPSCRPLYPKPARLTGIRSLLMQLLPVGPGEHREPVPPKP